MKLYDYQTKMLKAIDGGKHLIKAGCSAGKTLCSLMWAKSTGKDKVLVITQASVRDSRGFEREMEKFSDVFSEWYTSLSSFSVVSWSGLRKWLDANWNSLDEWAVIADEVAACKAGISSQQGKAFLQLAKRTDCWTGWTATPGDKWEDYYAYFTATGRVRNKTDFRNRFCVMQTYPFPKLLAKKNEDEYMAIKNEIWHEVDSSEMEAELPETIHQTIKFKTPTGYKQLMKTHELDGEFLNSAPALAHAARRLCGSKQKLDWLSDFVDGLDGSCIVFYSYETEREAIEKALKGKVGKIWNINGKTHDVPTEDTIDKHDIVLAQWQAGAFGLNLQFMNYWVSFSPNYSYTISCYDDKTEVLTPEGFKLFKDVKVGDTVEAYNMEDGTIQKVPVLNTICRPLSEGERLYEYKSIFAGIDIAMTGSHDLVMKGVDDSNGWHKEKLEDALHRKSQYLVPVAGDYGNNDNELSDDELMLIGWFLSDGCNSRGQITISQSEKNEEYVKEIKDLLDRLDIGYSITRSKKDNYQDVLGFCMRRHTTQDYKRGIGFLMKWLDRSLPSDLYNTLSKRQWLVLMEGYYHGNGCTKHRTDYKPKTKNVCCGNRKELAERLQHYLITHGIRCNLHYQKARVRSNWSDKKTPQWHLSYRANDSVKLQPQEGAARIALEKKLKSPAKWEELDYNGNVYCLTNRLGTTIVRRNGRVMIAGNCQARKRIHRHGQQRRCFYYYLQCENTIDEDVYKILREKGEFDEEMWESKNI